MNSFGMREFQARTGAMACARTITHIPRPPHHGGWHIYHPRYTSPVECLAQLRWQPLLPSRERSLAER